MIMESVEKSAPTARPGTLTETAPAAMKVGRSTRMEHAFSLQGKPPPHLDQVSPLTPKSLKSLKSPLSPKSPNLK